MITCLHIYIQKFSLLLEINYFIDYFMLYTSIFLHLSLGFKLVKNTFRITLVKTIHYVSVVSKDKELVIHTCWKCYE